LPVTSKISLIARITIRAKIYVCCSDLRVTRKEEPSLNESKVRKG